MAQLQELIRHDAPLCVHGSAVYPFDKELTKKYRFTSRFGDEVELFRVDGNVIHLPRALCPVGPKDERFLGEHVYFPKTPSPRPHQVQLFDETASFLKMGQSGIVSAYTGWGKTVLGYFAAAVVQRRTLVITTKDDIYMQWLKGAQTFLGLEPHEIGEIRQDKCEILGTKFCVAMIHTLSKDGKYDEDVIKLLQRSFGLVIFDECHRLPADQFSAVADMFHAKIRLGLSATPDRADGKEVLLYAHIGPVRAQTAAQLMIPRVFRYVTAWECPRVFRSDGAGGKKVVRLPHEPGKTTHIEKMLAADSIRNHFIAGHIKEAFERERKIVVFSTLLEHLKTLHRAVVDLGVPGKHMAFYGQVSNKAEREARDKNLARAVQFTTFTMASEGTDIPWLDLAVLAMPRADVRQPVGRVRREYPDKKPPAVVEYIDRDSPVFSGYANRREAWYKSIGCEILDM